MLLAQPGGVGGRWWRELRKHIVREPLLQRKFGEAELQVIYARVNPVVGAARLIYVGQSKCPRKRDSQHLVDGSKWMAIDATERRHVSASKVLWCDQLSGERGGGPGMWIDVPLAVFPHAIPAYALNRVERFYIHLVGTTNVRHTAHSRGLAQGHAAREGKSAARGRPVQCERGVPRRRDTRLAAAHTVTMYRWRERITPDLLGILRELQNPDNLPATVFVTPGKYSVTNRTTVQRVYGRSTLVLYDDMGGERACTLRKLGAGAWSHGSRLSATVERLRFTTPLEYGDFLASRGGAKQLAQYIGAHPHHMHSLREIACFRTYERLWTACGQVTPERLCASARAAINQQFRGLYGFSLRYAPCMRFPASAGLENDALKAAARCALRALKHPDIEARMRRRLKIIRTRAMTVGGVLHNWRSACRKFDPVQQGVCTCAHYPPEWRVSCPPNVLNVHGHFCILNTAYEGPGLACMRVSHKTPVTYTSDSIPKEVWSALRDLRTSLPAALQLELDEVTLEDLCQRSVQACEASASPALAAEVSMHEVLACKRYLRRAIISEVDKGPGLSAIYCPVANWHLMHLVWPSEPSRCCTLDKSEFDVLWEDVQAYNAAGWSRLSRLFGADSDGYPSLRTSLPHCYATWKLKAFLKQILKGRPISPHTKIPLKHLYNLIATAHQYLLMRIRTGRVSRMFTCREYAARLEGEMQAMVAQHGPLLTYSEIGDLSEMYTNLYHSDCDLSLARNADRYHQSTEDIGGHNLRCSKRICMPMRNAKLKDCRPGSSYDNEEFVTVTIEDIVNVCTYSNTRSIMFVGVEMRQYFQGIPMGEQGSCAKANGVALDAEIRCDELRQQLYGDSERNLSLQYVDDAHIRVVYSANARKGWTRESAVEYARQIKSCYPFPLFMEVEPQGQNVYRFLETDTYMPSERTCYTVHHNRPWTGRSYNMAASGGSLFYRTELNTAVNTCMRTVDNTTPLTMGETAGRIAARLREMLFGVGSGFSDTFVRHVLQRFGEHRDYSAFMANYGCIIRRLVWPVTSKGKP